MRFHPFPLLLVIFATAALAGSSGTGANPKATYCYNGGTIGSVGGGAGSGKGSSCAYNNPTASFGANYRNTQVSSQTPVACSTTAPQVVAEHLYGTSYGSSALLPPVADDDKFLLKVNETPAAIVEVDTSDALNDFSTMPDVPGTFTSGPGSGHFKGCPSEVMEGKLHRTWAAFGNTFYYGDPTASAVSDPAGFKYFACWQPITLGYSTVYQYRQWGTPQTPENACASSVGDSNSFDYYECIYCLRHPDDGVTIKDPQSWNGTAAPTNTVGSGYGYYITSNAKNTSNKSVFWSGAVIDYPPMFLPLYWTSKFIANNAMTDLTGNFLFPFRREVRTINNSMPSNSCSSSSAVGGNGMHPNCGRSNPYKGDSSFNSIFNFLDGQFSSFLQGKSVGTDTPLAGAIWDAASDYISGGLNPNGNTAGWCSTCARNHIIVLSAGNTCHDPGAGTLPSNSYDSSVSCTGLCSYTSSTCSARGANNTCEGGASVWPPQVASKIGNTDLLPSVPGTQNLVVDAIAIGSNQTALAQAASASGGTFVDANDDPTAIHDALFSVLNGLIKASVTSAATPLNSIQTAATEEEMFPQFVPVNNASIWQGHLYKTYFFSEFAAGCTHAGQSVPFPLTTSATTIQCPCINGQCTGRFSVDANNNFIIRANDGTLRGLTYAQLTSYGNRMPTPQEAFGYPLFTAVWDMATIMAKTSSYPWYRRNAYTLIDTNGDGKLTSADSLYLITNGATACSGTSTNCGVSATVANALTPYLGIVGTGVCSQLAALNIGVVYPDPANGYQTCAQAVLNYALGEDLLDDNSNNILNENRSMMLGDIYHSTPMDIGPPTQESFCDFNPRRCAATLFDVNHQTDSANWQALDYPSSYWDDTGHIQSTASNTVVDAYEAWANAQIYSRMPHLRVFGANDGWIHAVQFDCYTGVDSSGHPVYYGGPGSTGCLSMAGQSAPFENGSEVWALIPPDQLAKLPYLLLRKHQPFSDLTPIVRDVYSGTGAKKLVNDFYTVAIFGERNGGTHWTALDVTNPLNPKFLWMFPTVGSVDELRAGMSWGEYFPGSPPVVPIRMSTSIGGSPTYQSTPFHETWVVLLPGGYDRFGVKGHGIWMVDAYTGKKYWDSFGVTGMDFPVAAYPSAVAWGTKESAPTGLLNNGFFDTAVFGDTGGQLWVMRFNDIPSFGTSIYGETLVTNWGIARAFRQFDKDDTGAGPTYKMQNRVPFFHSPSLGRMTDSGYLRAYLGAGDRGNIDDQFLGTCAGGNMLACGKMGAVTLAERDQDLGTSTLRGALISYDGSYNANVTVGGTISYSSSSSSQCTPADNILNTCISAATNAGVNSSPNQPQVACVNTASGETCSYVSYDGLSVSTNFNSATGALSGSSTGSVYSTSGNGYYSRFYGITLFSPTRKVFTQSTQGAYDAVRVTETTAACGPSSTGICNLYPSGLLNNYGYPEAASSFNNPTPSGGTSGSSDGFFYYYPNIDERTAGNTLLGRGCVLWPTVQPSAPCNTDQDCASFSAGVAGGGTVQVGQCNTAAHECDRSTQCNSVGGSSAGHLYQMNAILGTPDCALVASTTPRVTFGTVLPPTSPQMVISINASGQVDASVVGGQGQENILGAPSSGKMLFRSYYDLEVPRSLHDCRHGGVCN